MNMNEGLKKDLVDIKYFKGSAFRSLGLSALRLGLRPSRKWEGDGRKVWKGDGLIYCVSLLNYYATR
jgi:hypothetical protein